MRMPGYIAHADWGINPKKRQVAVAEQAPDGKYRVVSLGPARSAVGGELSVGLNVVRRGDRQLLAGFDFPVGLPRTYAQRAGIKSFVEFLPEIGTGLWEQFAEVANTPEEVSLYRPFYPASGGKKGEKSHQHLLDGLNMTKEQLKRRCDLNAEMTFWTLGPKQVGKAALAGWEYLQSIPVERVRYWPFHGPLMTLLDGDHDTVVVTETYPTEFYQYFRSETSGSKTERDNRLRWIAGLFRWADELGVTWGVDMVRRVEAGFSDDINGEDEFDALVGLLEMIGVVTGAIESGEPRDDPSVTTVEGWMLGRRSTGWAPVTKGELTAERERLREIEEVPEPLQGLAADDTVPKANQTRSSEPGTSEEVRTSVEAMLAGLITVAHAVGYSDDDLIDMVQRELLK